MRRALSALLAAFLLLAPASALGLTVSDVSKELRCVTCGTPLDVSNAPAAQRMKALIQLRIDQGWEKQRILDEFVGEFGRQVLATPPKEGFDLVAWLLPALAVAAGLTAVPFVARAWARRRPRPPETQPVLRDEDRRLVDRELERFGDG